MTTVALVQSEELDALAEIHAATFAAPWTAEALQELLAIPGTAALAAMEGGRPTGFILVRSLMDEAEILTLAVHPASQRRGVGAALIAAGATIAEETGAAMLWLEVAADNAAALALYRSAEFEETGRRKGYYRRADAEPQDALIFRRVLNRPAASAYAASP